MEPLSCLTDKEIVNNRLVIDKTVYSIRWLKVREACQAPGYIITDSDVGELVYPVKFRWCYVFKTDKAVRQFDGICAFIICSRRLSTCVYIARDRFWVLLCKTLC